MATELTIRTNYLDEDVEFGASGAGYIALDLEHDYLIWTQGSAVVKDKMTHEPNEAELNEASTIIDPNADKKVPLLLLMDYSHNVGGAYYTHKVLGMGENKRYVLCFSFNGATANEPQLEAWDNDNHNSYAKHVLGNGTPADSMVKAVCTTLALPGADWVGVAMAGDDPSRVVKLNAGNGALGALASGETSQELYANVKILIPISYSTPSIESFIFCVRYTWN